MLRRGTTLRSLATLFALAALAGCGGGESAADGPVELKFGHVGAPESLYDVVISEFANRVNERLAGRVEVSVFGSSQLGSDETLLQKLKLGTVDFSLPSTIMSATVDEFGLYEMPYLVRDREHMKEMESEVPRTQKSVDIVPETSRVPGPVATSSEVRGTSRVVSPSVGGTWTSLNYVYQSVGGKFCPAAVNFPPRSGSTRSGRGSAPPPPATEPREGGRW